MRTPGVARGRRAFLAPIWIAAVAALLAGTVLFVGVRLAVMRFSEISTIVVLRHAEKLDAATADPPLSAEGEARAARLAAMFGGPSDAGVVSAIYASEARRAQQTAAPLAARLGLPVTTLPAGDVAALVKRIRGDGRRRTSLVVGHANTVPEVVAGLTDGRVRVSVDESDSSSVFVVTTSSFGPPSVLRLRY